MRNKLLFIIVVTLCVTCSLMGLFSYSISVKDKENISDSNGENITKNESDFDSLNYNNSFEVSDFSGSNINTIDTPKVIFEVVVFLKRSLIIV